MRTLIITTLLGLLASNATAETRLLRFPDLHGDTVVFTYAGDLWLAGTDGSNVRRLTSHPGQELFARFSPDGQHIAFTGQYDGGEQVYVVPVTGGEPKRLTWYPSEGPLPARWGYDHQVYGWTPDGEAVLFRSLREGFSLTGSRLYTVKLSGGLPEALPMVVSGAGALSTDGERILFSPLFRDFRTWKRYEGGWAQDLFIFELDGSGSRNITNHVRTDRDPMWMEEGIFFVSDRDDYLNIYAYDTSNGQIRQLTRHEGRDVRWASDDGSHRIVYELDGALRILDVRSDEDRQLTITVPADTGFQLGELVKVSQNLEGFDVSPNGERVLVAARGEVFSVPVEHGVVRNLTSSPGAHEREVAWSPKGDRVAWVSDESGEEEIYIADHLGQASAARVTSDSSTRLYNPLFSPDGGKIVFGDSEARIFVVDSDGGNKRQVANDPGFPQHDYSWSPDSRWLAYSMEDPNGYRSLHIWDGESGESRRITGEMFSEYNPVFAPRGGQLYFLSDRMFAPQLDLLEWNFANNRQTGVYAMLLTASAENPFAPRNLEGIPERDTGDKNGKKEDAGPPEVEIDFDGLSTRVARAPIEFDNLGSLSATDEHLLFIGAPAFFYGRNIEAGAQLRAYSLEDREEFPITDKVGGYALAAASKQIIVNQEGALSRFDIKKGEQEAKKADLDRLAAERIRAQEYEQIFDEVWRRFRDHFYVENMHGYDWVALRDRYRPLLVHVAHRADLNYLIGEMIAELSVGHAYVAGGDIASTERSSDALLGATFELDESAGMYRISTIYAGQNEEDKYRSPLTEPGINATVGDYVLAINGRSLTADVNPYSLLKGNGGRLLEVALAGNARGKDRRTVLVNPIASENDLLYLRWVDGNRARVTRETGGKIGYLHIPDMGPAGIYEFTKWFYGQVRKQGLIIDVRGNGGGNVSQMVINRLARDLVFMGYDRGIDNLDTYPNVVFTGPLVALLDEDSASDGDIFPGAFKALELGPLIGKRSWGGIIGIINLGPLMDGGSVFVPQFATASADGQWAIEGVGVKPDIEVDNPPEAVLRGEDPQLERAIQEAVQRLRTQPGTLPPRPADPIKTPVNGTP
ncbi:MAG: S41 family peptidase [Gammaproteobacteria bacterium]|nr:S41 family peptidase [Gammaproteobacteria bacterium]